MHQNFFVHARNHTLSSLTKQVTFHVYMTQKADKMASAEYTYQNARNHTLSSLTKQVTFHVYMT